jgi:hypothetical protein
MTERDEAFEELKAGHGLLRELPGVRVWGVDDGALVLGEEATIGESCRDACSGA